MTDNLRASGECNIYLTMKINFMSSKDGGKSQPMHSKSDNTEILIGNSTNSIINQLIKNY